MSIQSSRAIDSACALKVIEYSVPVKIIAKLLRISLALIEK